jgi:hypothetical protein
MDPKLKENQVKEDGTEWDDRPIFAKGAPHASNNCVRSMELITSAGRWVRCPLICMPVPEANRMLN